jgi:hypothetical protein
MKLPILALAGAAVALSAMPADARHHRHHVRAYRVGYVFGPDYSYTDFGALPQPIVTRYHLRENFRYVNRNGFVYVVNPDNYRVVRVITVH